MSDPEMTARTLERAARLIDELGWCQGEQTEPDGGICAATALMRAAQIEASEYGDVLDIYELSRMALGFSTGDVTVGLFCLASWNDQPGRTRQEVVDRLRGAARELMVK